jgi:hypothetical protein
MTIDVEFARDAHTAPEAVISGDHRGAARQPRAASRQRGVLVLGLGAGAVAGYLGSRRFHVQVLVGIIGLAALAGLARESQTRSLARLAAWDKRQHARQPHSDKARRV